MPVPVAPGTLTANFDASGNLTLSFDGHSLEDPVAGTDQQQFFEADLYEQDGSITTVNDFTHAPVKSWTAGTRTQTHVYPWATVTWQYGAATNNRMDITLTITNTSGKTMRSFQSTVLNFGGDLPIVEEISFAPIQPSAAIMTFKYGYLALVETSGDRPDCYLYMRKVTGDQCKAIIATKKPAVNDNWKQYHDRAIENGETRTYNLSFRCARGGTPSRLLIDDANEDFRTQHPYLLNWTDRRRIGYVFPAGSSEANRTATNPRGWFNDGTVDVTTQVGLAAWATRMLAWFDTTAADCVDQDCQGVIIWDLEGMEHDDHVYIGHPQAAEQLAPEWSYTVNGTKVIDLVFDKIADAGLRSGVTLRPQIVNADDSVSQVAEANQAQAYIDKITYAKNRWGCTLFYIDSTDQYSTIDMMAQVYAAHPDVLLIPENENALMYRSSAPYQQPGTNDFGPTERIRSLYPQAFEVINGPAGSNNLYVAQLENAIRTDNIVIVNGHEPFAPDTIVNNLYAGLTMNSIPNSPLAHASMATPTTLSSTTLSASGHKVGALFIAPKTGTISQIGFSQVRVGTSPTFEARLETVSSNLPSGTLFGTDTKTATFSDATGAGAWYKKSLTANASVTKGDLLAVVIAYVSGTIDGSNNLVVGRSVTNAAGFPTFLAPVGVSHNGTSWSTAQVPPTMALYYDDGTIVSGYPTYDIASFNFNSGSAADEFANKFTAPFAGTMSGVIVSLSFAASSSATVTLYDSNSSVVYEQTVTPSMVTSGSNGMVYIPFAANTEIDHGAVYRVAVKANNANNLTMHTIKWNSTVERNYGCGIMQGSSRADAGAWTDTALTTYHIYPVMSQIVAPTATIEGVETDIWNDTMPVVVPPANKILTGNTGGTTEHLVTGSASAGGMIMPPVL